MKMRILNLVLLVGIVSAHVWILVPPKTVYAQSYIWVSGGSVSVSASSNVYDAIPTGGIFVYGFRVSVTSSGSCTTECWTIGAFPLGSDASRYYFGAPGTPYGDGAGNLYCTATEDLCTDYAPGYGWRWWPDEYDGVDTSLTQNSQIANEYGLTFYANSQPVTIEWEILIEDTGTPTPTPTALPATPFPVAQACIPASVIPTRTPTRAPVTSTPFGTRTPGPTATITPTPSGSPTPLPGEVNLLANFNSVLTPWTRWTNGGSNFVTWSSDNGPNNQPGIAFLPFTADGTTNEIGQMESPNTEPVGPLMVFERPSPYMPRPVRLVADVQYPQLAEGTYAYVQVFYWLDNGLGTEAWYYAGAMRVNVAWHTVTMLITPPTNRTVRAVALRGVVGISTIENPLGFGPQAISGQGVMLDNLRITAGSQASNPTAVGLPICGSDGGGNGITPPRPQKMCAIRGEDVDVFNCPRPNSILEIGGWISWLTCNVTTYFTFHTANFQQMEDIRARNQSYQPFAAATELITTINVIQQAMSDAQNIPTASTSPVTVSDEFSGGSIDDFLLNPNLPPVPTYNPSADPFAEALQFCPDPIRNFSQVASPGACFAIYHLRTSELLGIFQLVFNIACYGGLFIFFYGILARPKESL